MKYLLALIIALLPFGAFAESGWNLSTSSSIIDPNSQYHQRWPVAFSDDITSDQDPNAITLTAEEHHQALVWGLSDSQEKRYLFLMHNKSGVYYHDRPLSPVEILGLNTRDDQERVMLATQAATQEAQKITEELAYDSAYHQAFVQLMQRSQLPVIQPFDVSRYSPYQHQPLALQAGDQLVLFIHLKDAVKPIMTTLMKLINKTQNIQLNIYFVGNTVTQAQVFNWAKAQTIPAQLVSKKIITLNLGNSHYQQLNNAPKLPALYLIHAGVSTPIDTGKF